MEEYGIGKNLLVCDERTNERTEEAAIMRAVVQAVGQSVSSVGAICKGGGEEREEEFRNCDGHTPDPLPYNGKNFPRGI